MMKLKIRLKFLLFFIFVQLVYGKIHFLSPKSDSRRNILLSRFGYNINGTFDFVLSNFTVPDAVIPLNDDKDKNGVFGFTLSRSNMLAEGIRSSPHICQLQQHDQALDALFFIFDFSQHQMVILRSGALRTMQLCRRSAECPIAVEGKKVESIFQVLGIKELQILTQDGLGDVPDEKPPDDGTSGGLFSKLLNSFKSARTPYKDMIPLEVRNGQYNTEFGIRFRDGEEGLYNFLYHNCFNYRAHGYSDRVAVDFSISIVERNEASYLSAGDILKPRLYVYAAFVFALVTVLWMNILCKSDGKSVYKLHKLMNLLIVLKVLSLFFHGMNYYFVSEYGHQREIWAITFYVVHLLKGALLFGTIILIGTGYTLFKNFLSDRDRSLFIVVLPLQVIDNIAMVIIEEGEFGEQYYFFWFQIFIFLDLICCLAILIPIIWSMRHLQEGARTDGKAAFNLQKLRLFRHFYVMVVSYIYFTRVTKFIVEYMLPFNWQWVSEAIVELSTLFFFCVVGATFRPLKSNPYLRFSEDAGETDPENPAIALTTNGLYENVSRVQRVNVLNELSTIPGTIGDLSDVDSDDEHEGGALLPKAAKISGHTVL